MKAFDSTQRIPAAASVANDLDQVLAIQFAVAWAGEGRSKPKRFGWWATDLVDEAGGGDLFARLAPRTHAWAALEAVREAARRVDAAAREKHGDGDRLRTIFFLGFELDEKVSDRLSAHKRQGDPPSAALPLPFELGAAFDPGFALAGLAPHGAAAFEAVPPIGRQLKGAIPAGAGDVVRALAAGLVPPGPEYPMPFFRSRS